MISYQLYKVLHISFIFFILTFIASMLLGNFTAKWPKILAGVSGLLILVTGMGLIARLGFKHDEPFPLWIWGKFIFWLLLTIGGPVFAKRLVGKSRVIAFFGLMAVAIAAATFAVYKF